jgi:hypothetical protein
MSDHSDLDYDRPPPLRTIDRLEAENAKLRAEVKRLEVVRSVYRLEAFDLQAKLRTVDLQNEELRKIVGQAIQEFEHSKIGHPRKGEPTFELLPDPYCVKCMALKVYHGTEKQPDAITDIFTAMGHVTDKQPPLPRVERDLGPSLPGGAAPVNFTEKQLEETCGVVLDGGEAGPYRCAFKKPCPDHGVQKQKCANQKHYQPCDCGD